MDRRRNIDALQTSLTMYITYHTFPWLCLVLLLNRRDWKRPVILILISYCFFQATGSLLQKYMNYIDKDKYKDYDYPYSLFNWYLTNAVAHLVWLTGEIIGDWYSYLRTKALIQNKRKLKPVLITCIIYNIIKVIHISMDFIVTPKSFEKVDGKPNGRLLMNKIIWYIFIAISQIVNFIYDLTVILALKNSLFNKLETFKYKSNNFLEKFKQISEFRIFISIIISIFFFPYPIFQIINYSRRYLHPELKTPSFTDKIENLRSVGLRFTYTFMYIDQILLRFYVSKSKYSQYHKEFNSQDSQLLVPPLTPGSNISNPTSLISDSFTFNKSFDKNFDINEQGIPKILNNQSTVNKHFRRNIDSSIYLQNLRELKNQHKE